MRVLMLCNTRYQILNAIVDDCVDFICISEAEDINRLTERIRELNIFNKVLRVKQKKVNVHAYLKNIVSGKKNDAGLCEVIKNTFLDVCSSINAKKEDDLLVELVDGYSKGDYKQYSKILANCGTEIVNTIYRLVKEDKNKCELAILDEGVNSYVVADWGSFGTVADSAYLYEPVLCTSGIKKLYTLPKIENPDIKKAVVHVFGWDNEVRSINNSIVIFEQPYRRMPKYFFGGVGCKILRKILYNSYKKHLRDSIQFDHQEMLISYIGNYKTRTEKFIKYHPASFDTDEYDWKNQIKQMQIYKTPWEVQLLNSENDNNICVTVGSTAACTTEIFNNSNNNNKYIFLFDIYRQEFEIEDAKYEFFLNMKRHKPNKVFMPRSIQELDKILSDLLIAQESVAKPTTTA